MPPPCPTIRSLCVVMGVMVWALSAMDAFAQSTDAPTLEAELSSRRAFVGDTVSYQLLVRGTDDQTRPEVAFPESVSARYTGAGRQTFTSTRIVNGRQQIVRDGRITHEYRLRVLEPGTIEIPPAELDLNGDTLRSRALSLDARLPEEASADAIRIDHPGRPIYVGETVEMEITWWIDAQTRDFTFDATPMPDALRVRPAPIDAGGRRAFEFELGGRRVVGVTDQGVHEGQAMNRLRFRLRLTPESPGSYTLGPIRAVFTRLDEFGRGTRMYAESEPSTLEVIPVPDTGRPPGYTGLIGHYTLGASASNTDVQVGDPIELRVRVEGTEPLDGLEDALDLSALESAGFRVSPDGWRRTDQSSVGSRVLTTTIRASNDAIDEIPPVPLPSFDPESGEYTVFRTDPIAISAERVRRVTLEDAVMSRGQDRDADPAPTRATLARNPSVLWSHPSAETIRDADAGLDVVGRLMDPRWAAYILLCLALPPLGLAARAWRNRRGTASARINRAWTQARRLHAKGDHAGAIRRYAAGVLDVDPETLTGDDIARLGAPEEIVSRSRRVLVAAEGARFGRRSDTDTDDRRVLHDLRRATRRPVRSAHKAVRG